MTPTEQLRAFIERVKDEAALAHVYSRASEDEKLVRSDALRAVLALEETVNGLVFAIGSIETSEEESAQEALARAAAKVPR